MPIGATLYFQSAPSQDRRLGRQILGERAELGHVGAGLHVEDVRALAGDQSRAQCRHPVRDVDQFEVDLHVGIRLVERGDVVVGGRRIGRRPAPPVDGTRRPTCRRLRTTTGLLLAAALLAAARRLALALLVGAARDGTARRGAARGGAARTRTTGSRTARSGAAGGCAARGGDVVVLPPDPLLELQAASATASKRRGGHASRSSGRPCCNTNAHVIPHLSGPSQGFGRGRTGIGRAGKRRIQERPATESGDGIRVSPNRARSRSPGTKS